VKLLFTKFYLFQGIDATAMRGPARPPRALDKKQRSAASFVLCLEGARECAGALDKRAANALGVGVCVGCLTEPNAFFC
jgi:hypothetical protein